MHTPRLSITKLLALTGLILACGHTWADTGASKKAGPPNKSGNIIKWVDEKGVTHYGDSMPAQAAGRDSSVLNNQGVVIQRNKPGIAAKPEEDKALIDQLRRDRALRAAYSSEQDIDAARDRNLQTDATALKELEQRLGSTQARIDANKKQADDLIKRKKPVPSDLTQALQNDNTEIAQTKQQMAQRQQSMEAIRQRYENDKRRYIELETRGPTPSVAEPVKVTNPAAKPVMAPSPKPATTKH